MKKSQLGTWGKDDRGYHFWKLRQAGKDPIVIKRKDLAKLKIDVKKAIAELHEKGVIAPVKSDPPLKPKMTRWLAEAVKPFRADATHRSYEQHCNNYIFPSLGTVKESKLTHEHVQGMIAKMRAQGLSDSTIHGAVRTLFAFLGKRRSAEIKEKLTLPSTPIARERVLEEDEILAVLDEVFRQRELKTRPGEFQHEYRDRFLIGFLLNTGVRISEALGSVIFTLNLEEGEEQIDLKSQLKWTTHEDKPRTWRLAPLKGRKSRIIHFNPLAAEYVRGQLQMIAEERAKAGEGYEYNGLLFPTESGRPMDSRNVKRTLDKILVTLGIEHTTIHDLRRSYLTHLAAAEERMQFVAAIAGHSDLQTTMKVYVKAKELGKRQATMKVSFGQKTQAAEETSHAISNHS